MSNPSTVEFPFSTGVFSFEQISVAETTDSLLTALAVELNLELQFINGSITSYTDPNNVPDGNAEFVETVAGDEESLSANTTVVLVADGAAGVGLFDSFGTASQTIVDGAGGLDYIGHSASGTILAGGGGNLVDIELKTSVTGGYTIVTSGGNNTIDAETGNDTISAGTGANSLDLGTGNDLVNSTGADHIFIEANTTAASDTISALGDNSGDFIFDSGSNHVTFLNGNAASTFEGGAGSDTVYAGVGGGTVLGGTGGNNLLVGGTGQVTLAGGGNGDVLQLTTGSASDLVQAGAGNETLLGGVTTGADTFQAGTGNDSISAGRGADTFQFVNGQAGGVDTVSGFGNNSHNTIALQGYGANEAANAVASATVSHGSTTFTLSDNTSVTLVGFTHLTAANFS